MTFWESLGNQDKHFKFGSLLLTPQSLLSIADGYLNLNVFIKCRKISNSRFCTNQIFVFGTYIKDTGPTTGILWVYRSLSCVTQSEHQIALLEYRYLTSGCTWFVDYLNSVVTDTRFSEQRFGSSRNLMSKGLVWDLDYVDVETLIPGTYTWKVSEVSTNSISQFKLGLLV